MRTLERGKHAVRAHALVSWRNAGTLLIVFLGIVWFFTLRPGFLGGPASYITVSGASMEPTMSSDDLVVVRDGDHYEVGDIIAYHVPEGEAGAGIVVIHRVVGGSGEAGYVTRGDNRGSDDRWHPRDADVLGKRWFDVPGAGRILAFLHDPLFLALGAGLIAGMIALGAFKDGEKHRPAP